MIVPALIYLAVNWGNPATLRGWAIPAATDIAFALGVLALLGPRVPVSLKVFLMALAIIDDLGAVLIIAAFYTSDLNIAALGGAIFVSASLRVSMASAYSRLPPYLRSGLCSGSWCCSRGSTPRWPGSLLAFTIPIRTSSDRSEDGTSPLHRLEHALHRPVAYADRAPLRVRQCGRLLRGAQPPRRSSLQRRSAWRSASSLASSWGSSASPMLAVRARLADSARSCDLGAALGVALLCGIGFTMSLFIGLLAFAGRSRAAGYGQARRARRLARVRADGRLRSHPVPPGRGEPSRTGALAP